MLGWLRRRWFESRALPALQVHYGLPLKKPLPPFEALLLRGAANLTMGDGGTPFDAAARFYAAYAEAAAGRGVDLNSINFGGALAQLWNLRDQMKFTRDHIAAFKTLSERAGQISN